jgi:hypothetical protein
MIIRPKGSTLFTELQVRGLIFTSAAAPTELIVFIIPATELIGTSDANPASGMANAYARNQV